MEPSKKQDKLLQDLGKEPKRIEVMINLSKIWRWFKKRRRHEKSSNDGSNSADSV